MSQVLGRWLRRRLRSRSASSARCPSSKLHCDAGVGEPSAQPEQRLADAAVHSLGGGWATYPSRRYHALLLIAPTLIVAATSSALADGASVTFTDATGEAVARPTDPGADGPFDPVAHRLPDLWEATIGAWTVDDPNETLFVGSFSADGEFARIDLLVGGLVNPPGRTDPNDFAPFTYGPNPVFGFVEIDMDQDVNTGGELDAPEYHYLGNIVRFGGKPAIAEFQDRVALDASAFDGDFLTGPFVDRHGEEFHLALLGKQYDEFDMEEVVGNGDDVFDEGETWQIIAPWFHRAHGYEPFSLAEGGEHSGEYMPDCAVQFHHDLALDATLISLVLPLTNVGAGLMEGEDPEPPNGNPSDQASVLEALIDLRDSAIFLSYYPTGLPEEAIITGWENKDPEDFLDPTDWNITVLLGTSYTAEDPSGEYFVWTDTYPDAVRGDVNGDGQAEGMDQQLIQQFIADEDAGDGQVDGRVVLADFAWNFSVFDINHSGVVDDLDVTLVSIPGDLDHDGDVDLADLAQLLGNYGTASGASYEDGDLDGDGDVDLSDLAELLAHYGLAWE